ncbi:hypothetical protein Sar04_30680 [Salinispora arenicola]|uniref:GYD domain-containing protein n=1 Tax=Salinispora arenicola TaxID=168697 RepID=A0ABQ4JUE1_SALAC|nr:hypothetical protein Sar04_30680 [Salinispora arenicola]
MLRNLSRPAAGVPGRESGTRGRAAGAWKGGAGVARYLFVATYTAHGIAGLGREGGTVRAEVVRALIENAGGRVEALYFGFGKHDLFVSCEVPDSTITAALGIAARSTGAVKAHVITLLTPEEIDEAAALPVTYQAPGE